MVEAKVERGPKDYTVDPSKLVLHSHRENPQTRSGLKREAPEASTLSSNSIFKDIPIRKYHKTCTENRYTKLYVHKH